MRLLFQPIHTEFHIGSVNDGEWQRQQAFKTTMNRLRLHLYIVHIVRVVKLLAGIVDGDEQNWRLCLKTQLNSFRRSVWTLLPSAKFNYFNLYVNSAVKPLNLFKKKIKTNTFLCLNVSKKVSYISILNSVDFCLVIRCFHFYQRTHSYN